MVRDFGNRAHEVLCAAVLPVSGFNIRMRWTSKHGWSIPFSSVFGNNDKELLLNFSILARLISQRNMDICVPFGGVC